MKHIYTCLCLLSVVLPAFAGSVALMLKCQYTSSQISHWTEADHKSAEVILVFPNTNVGTWVKWKKINFDVRQYQIMVSSDEKIELSKWRSRACGGRSCHDGIWIDRDTGYAYNVMELPKEEQIEVWGNYQEWRGILMEYYCKPTVSVIP